MSQPRKLPRGRHGLSADQVRQDQVERITESVTSLVAEVGYGKTTVAKVIKRAGVSRATFYTHFDNLADSLALAQKRAVNRLDRAITAQDPGAATATEGIARALERALATLAAAPGSAELIFEVAAIAGPGPQRAQSRALKRWAGRLETCLEPESPMPGLTGQTALGALSAVLRYPPRAPGIQPKQQDLLYAVLLPYVGPENAAARCRLITTPESR